MGFMTGQNFFFPTISSSYCSKTVALWLEFAITFSFFLVIFCFQWLWHFTENLFGNVSLGLVTNYWFWTTHGKLLNLAQGFNASCFPVHILVAWSLTYLPHWEYWKYDSGFMRTCWDSQFKTRVEKAVSHR